jgi:hypothetical protein
MEVSVYDYDRVGNNDIIGNAIVDVWIIKLIIISIFFKYLILLFIFKKNK